MRGFGVLNPKALNLGFGFEGPSFYIAHDIAQALTSSFGVLRFRAYIKISNRVQDLGFSVYLDPLPTLS